MDRHNLKYITSFLLLILFVTGCSDELDISGCPYPDSCNYNLDGTDEDSCWYPNGDCLCEDGEDAILDCTGECGGSAVEDCAGNCDGIAEFDECGVCNGTGVFLPENSNINITAAVNPWDLGFIADQADIIFSENCLDGYDSNDIPEPPAFGTNWIKTYFNYPDWDTPFGNEFTETCYSLCQMNEFYFIVESNAQGELEILIDLKESHFAMAAFSIQVFENDEAVDYTLTYDMNGDFEGYLNIYSNLQGNTPKEFLIKLPID